MNLERHFKSVEDYRVQGRCMHDLSDILIIILLGTLADCEDFPEMQDYANDKHIFLKETLGLKLKNGIPSEDTLSRMVRYLNPKELEKSLRSACQEILTSLTERHIRIDGKEMRGTIPSGKKHADIQVLSAWLSEDSISFGQLQIEKKTNEITAIPKLLDQIDCQGSIISIDAIGCQKAIVEKIIDKKADYVIALKKNQGELYEQIENYMEQHKLMLAGYEQINKDHGRGEKRSLYLNTNLEFLEQTKDWQGIKSVLLVESTRILNGKESIHKRLFISSLSDKTPEKMATLIRNHWGIENGLHWHLDITFGEDDSKIKKDNGPINMNIFRKLGLFLLTKEKSKISLKRKRKKAARDDEFMLEIIKSA